MSALPAAALLKIQVAAGAQTGAFLHATTTTSAAGWSATILAGMPAGQPSAFFYLCDPAEGILWLTTISGNQVAKALASIKTAGHSEVDVRSSLGTAIDFLAPDAPPPPGFTRKEVEAIAAGSALAYAAKTQTWKQMGNVADGVHFVILRYRQSKKDWLLRPFALRGEKDRPIPANLLTDAVGQVVTIDRARHPDWFPNSNTSNTKGFPR